MDSGSLRNDGRQRLHIALLQLAVEDGRPGRNLKRALAMLGSIPPADLFLLPELWTTGYAHESWDDAADHHTPGVVERLQEEARVRNAWIGGSLVTRRSDSQLVNRFWLVGPKDNAPVLYDKGHLFAPMGETERLVAGKWRVRAGLGSWTAGLSLCYDLRFPEMYRLDALAGANLLLVPSEWPSERRDILELLARARAAENQAYLALCNRTGEAEDGTVFGGGSMLVGPYGEVVSEAGVAEETLTCVADLGRVEKARSDIPVLEAHPGLPDDRLSFGNDSR